jgi:regulator of replication initiation timing
MTDELKCIKGETCLYCDTKYCRYKDETECLKQETEELKELLQKTKQEVSKLSDKVPQMIMRNKELEKENEELKKILHQPDFILALADVSNGERERRINRLSRYEQALRRILNRTRLMLSIHSKRIATNGELFSIISEAHALTNEVLKCQRY